MIPPAFFFPSTQGVDNQLGDSFGFIWASYVGLRDIWWQVRGLHAEFPSLHINQIKAKFLSGLPVPGGIDLARTCLETDWTIHEARFAKWILFEACTLYETWTEKVCSDLFLARDAENYRKWLQFPTRFDRNGNPMKSYRNVIDAANTTTSLLIASEFFPKLKTSKYNRWLTLEDHLIAYRFFKECRNACIHSEGTATQQVLDSYPALIAAQSKTPAPFRHAFTLPAPVLGDPLNLNLKDCILFATIVRLLICTFDAALCVTQEGERLLEVRLRELKSKKSSLFILPNDQAKRAKRIRNILAAARVPDPASLQNIENWMRSRNLVL